MPIGLPATGTLRYDGYEFRGASKVACEAEFVRDDADRTIVYHRYVITVSAIITNDAGVDGDIENIRRRLGQQGRSLEFTNRGFGNDMKIGSGDSPTGFQRDVKLGPKPEILTWEPVGDNLAVEVVWKVVACVPKCFNPYDTRSAGPMAINYDIAFDINEKGYTTRTITGYVEIAQTRVAGQPADTADAYRTEISPTRLDGFQRTQNWAVSADKARVNFSIVDKQIQSANAYPPSVVAISGRHRVSWARFGGGASRLQNSLSMDIEISPDSSPVLAWVIFRSVLRKRIEHAANTRRNPVMITSFDIDEDLFGRGGNFSARYMVLNNLTDVIADTGLWQPIGTAWPAWNASMTLANSHRGIANLFHDPATDAIVDLCGPAHIPWSAQRVREYTPTPPRPEPLLYIDKPPPDKSWVVYSAWFEHLREQPLARQSYVQSPAVESASFDPNSAGSSFPPTSGSAYPETIVTGGQPRYSVDLVGTATRVGHEIPRPHLLRIGDADAFEGKAKFVHRVLAQWQGQTVYQAGWRIEYILNKSPGTIKPPANPMET